MISHNPYYYGSIRKIIIAFGALFKSLEIIRRDINGNAVKTIKVPIDYGNKEHWYYRKTQNPMPGTNDQVEFVVPRMSFEMTGLTYDGIRHLPSIGRNVTAVVLDNTVIKTQFNPVPYNISFNLYIIAKTTEDSLMIVEQILPFFTPDFTLTIDDIPDLNLKKDIPFTLTGVDFQDDWDQEIGQRRTISYTLSFMAQAYIYPPTELQKIIRKTIVEFNLDDEPLEDMIVTPNPLDEAVVDDPDVTYTIVNNPIRVLINPSTVTINSNQSTTFNVGITNSSDVTYSCTLTPNLGTATINLSTITYHSPTVLTQTVVMLKVISHANSDEYSFSNIIINP